MFELIQSNPILTRWIVGTSLIMFVGTIIILPYLITLIPDDYFSHERREVSGFEDHHPVIRLILLLIKNLLGYTLIFLGIVMLVLPGQGILTMITGLILIDFPNKYKIERWLVSRRRVLKTMNWLRSHAHKSPLKIN